MGRVPLPPFNLSSSPGLAFTILAPDGSASVAPPPATCGPVPAHRPNDFFSDLLDSAAKSRSTQKTMSRTRLQQLTDLGQSVWYDNISRELIGSGSLEKLRQRGIRGVTSNPTIFEKAIANTNTYDSAIEELGKRGMDARQIFEQVAIEDIRAACDVLRPVFDATKGQDGYVSYEVSPSSRSIPRKRSPTRSASSRGSPRTT